MLRFFNRLLVTLLLVGTALIITLTNSEPATIRVGNWFQVSSYAGVIYLGVFSAGCIAASIVGLFFGLKAYFRERRLLATERNRQAFISLIEKSRSLMAANEWAKAQAGWEAILRKDPENIVARVELSKCLEQLGDPREALRVLDATRAGSRRNIEVLFRAAELNQLLGNNTAAMDNLALIAGEAPSKRSLEMARETSENLGRIDDALEYHSELERLGMEGSNSKAVRARLTFAQIVRDSPDATTLRETLIGFVKRHPFYTPALEKLASIELDALSFESAAELLVKVAKASPGDLSKWRVVIDLWLNKWPGDARKKAERAIAAARASTQDSKGATRIEAECLVAETLLSLNKVEDALLLLDELPTLLKREGLESDRYLQSLIIGLRGVCFTRLGRTKDTFELWENLLKSSVEGTSVTSAVKLAANGTEPSPTLSTP